MQAIEFETDLTSKKVLEIPAALGEGLPVPAHVRVIVLVEDTGDDPGWRELSYHQFLRAYSDEDAIYDDYDAHLSR